MAKEKNSSETPAPKKTAAKKAPAKSAAKKASPATKSAVAHAAPSAPPVTSGAPAARKGPSAAEMYDEIRRRAFELYNERGGEHGSHEADWHRAESEVRAKYK